MYMMRESCAHIAIKWWTWCDKVVHMVGESSAHGLQKVVHMVGESGAQAVKG